MEVSMKKTIVFLALCVASAGALSAFETTKTLNLSAQDIRRLDIRAGAGSLTVTGREGLAAIEVKAEVVAPDVRDKDMEEYLRDRVELTLEKRGDIAVLVGRIRHEGRLFDFGENARVDLTVTVPKTMALDIDDGSGDMVVEDLAAAVRIEDGSGAIRVARVAGNVRIDDGSGEVVVERVEGNLEIDDGSGGLEISDVTGDVTIDDGSGEILVRRVGGIVTVDDGSGGIDIEDVEKDVRLINSGSGGVDISGVKGRVIRSL
jgi:DUF4097 and DUF4098 domain-containing protein YvlB